MMGAVAVLSALRGSFVLRRVAGTLDFAPLFGSREVAKCRRTVVSWQYTKIDGYIIIVLPLYGICPLLGVFIIRGFTVFLLSIDYFSYL